MRFLDDDDSTERKYEYTYDGFGNLVKVDKPDADTIEYAYNGLNQMTQEKFDANNFNDFEYDCCMLTKHQQTVGGSQEDPFELTYDKMKRMTKEQYPDSANPKTEYFDYEYDRAGRRIEMTDPTYGRAAQHPKPMRWKYEEDGNVIKVGRTEDDNYLSSQGEDYHVLYDDRGRIWKVFYPGDDNQPVMEVEYQYTSGGQIAKIIARNLTQGTPTDIYCQEFEYDVNGRKIRQVQKEKESDADTAAYYVVSFSYDSRDMLTEEKFVRWNSGTSTWDNMYWARYKYDTAGNMVHREVDQIVNGSPKQYFDGPFIYSRGYQLTGFTRKGSFGAETRTFTLTYDANGNMTHISQSATFTDTFYNITEMEFQFDEKNRMTHYRFGGAGSYHQIKYDALGRVRERVNLTPTTSKYYSDVRQLIQQLDNSDNVDFDYFRGPTGLMRQLDVDASNKKRFYIKDPLGTVLALVNPSDLSVKHYNYNAWGEHLDKDDTDFPTDTNLMRYIGCRVEAFGDSTAQTDAIYHLDHRFYIPSTMKFLQREPLVGFNVTATDFNPYLNTGNNPSNHNDPSGFICPSSGCSMGLETETSGMSIYGVIDEPFDYSAHQDESGGFQMQLTAQGLSGNVFGPPNNCWPCYCPGLGSARFSNYYCTIPAGGTPPLPMGPNGCYCNTTFTVPCIFPCYPGGIGPAPPPGTFEPYDPTKKPWDSPFGNGGDSNGGSGSYLPFSPIGDQEPDEPQYPRCPGLVGETQNMCDKAGAKFTMPYVHLATMQYCYAEYFKCMIQCAKASNIGKKIICQWCCYVYKMRCLECVRR